MQFNPYTNTLYTNNGQVIKKLQCPYAIQWKDCEKSKDFQKRMCQKCKTPILDTQFYSDSELLKKSRSQSRLCLKVDMNQENIMIHSAGTIISKSERK